MKMKDGKISSKEESERGSLLSRKILMTIRAAVEERGRWAGADGSYQVYVGHTVPIPTNGFTE